MEIRGTVKSIRWRDLSRSRSNNQIIVVQSDDGKDYVVSGFFPYLRKNERIILDIKESNKEGLFVSTGLKFEIEYNLYSLYKILTTIRGIGDKTGKKIVSAVAEKRSKEGKPLVVATIDEFYRDIEELDVVDTKFKELIRNKIYEFALVDELLYIFGESMAYRDLLNIATRLVQINKVEVVLENLYNLVDFEPNININRLDTYVLREFNYDKTNPNRLFAFIKYAFHKFAIDYKFTLVDKDLLTRRVQKLAKVPIGPIVQALDQLVLTGEVVKLANGYMLKEYYEMEKTIAEKFKKKLDTPITEYIPNELLYMADQIIEHESSELGIDLSDEQKDAIRNVFLNRISIITGGAGTGKSTVIKLIYKIAKHAGLDPIVLAPTGKAANRLAELDAKTIHFALGWDGIKSNEKIRNKFIIVDEASMVDLRIMYELVKNINDDVFLVLVGDPYQLPPVGAGAIFEVMIRTNLFNTTMLKTIYRQQGNADLLELAYAINRRDYGKVIDFINKQSNSVKILIAKPVDIVESVKYLLNMDTNNVIVLTPIRNIYIGSFHVNNFNRAALTQVSDSIRVICVENDYERKVFNGEIGYLVGRTNFRHIMEKEDLANDKTFKIIFNGREHEYDLFSAQRYIEPAYSITVHKAQGSEFDGIVAIPLMSEHVKYWNKRLLYTAVTRAKNKLLILTDINFQQTLYNILMKREIPPKSYFEHYMAELISEGGDTL